MLKQALLGSALAAFALCSFVNAQEPAKLAADQQGLWMRVLQVPDGEIAIVGAMRLAPLSHSIAADAATYRPATAGGPAPLAPHSAEVP